MSERSMRAKALLRRLLRRYKVTRVHAALKLGLEELEPWRDQFFPFSAADRSYAVPRGKPTRAGASLEVPPHELRAGYGSTDAEYLASGQVVVEAMRKLADECGKPLSEAGRILELGCAAGRMLRWLVDLCETSEVWGADISAPHVYWCREHLSPPLQFLLTTTFPHLPFVDRFFGFVFAGSVFTHIDDMAQPWFLELARVLRPGGCLYLTIHDEHTLDLLEGRDRDDSFAHYLRTCPEYDSLRRSDFGMFTIGRSYKSQVFYNADWLLEGIAPVFRPLKVQPESYGYQTGLLLERV